MTSVRRLDGRRAATGPQWLAGIQALSMIAGTALDVLIG